MKNSTAIALIFIFLAFLKVSAQGSLNSTFLLDPSVKETQTKCWVSKETSVYNIVTFRFKIFSLENVGPDQLKIKLGYAHGSCHNKIIIPFDRRGLLVTDFFIQDDKHSIGISSSLYFENVDYVRVKNQDEYFPHLELSFVVSKEAIIRALSTQNSVEIRYGFSQTSFNDTRIRVSFSKSATDEIILVNF